MDNNKKRREKQHAFAVDIEDEHPNKHKGDTYLFWFFSLIGSIVDYDDMWLVDNGESRHTVGYREKLSSMMERRLSQRVELSDNHNYAIKGVAKASINLESDSNVHLNNVLYVLVWKRI